MRRTLALLVFAMWSCFAMWACHDSSAPTTPDATPPEQAERNAGRDAQRSPLEQDAAQIVVVAEPARAGAVEGTTENSDAFLWRKFTEFTAPLAKDKPSPVAFETWASDKDTFSADAGWPDGGVRMDLHPSVLATITTPRSALPDVHAMAGIDVNCGSPPGAAVGGFPDGCIAEQVSRNYAEWNYIVSNKLNTKEGLAAAYAKGVQVEMPTESLALKGDWIPLPDLLRWIPELGSIDAIRKLYYTVTVKAIDYALVSMHVTSRQNPNWVWGTFEHQMNPGRCDYIGCFDSFGAQTAAIPPNKSAVNTQYGACPKTAALHALMTKANLSPVWENYCLKSTQVDYTAMDGTPYVLGNSVIEGIVGNGTIAASSCISCHAYASFGPGGTTTARALAILPFNPTGKPMPSVLAGSRTFAFNWGVVTVH